MVEHAARYSNQVGRRFHNSVGKLRVTQNYRIMQNISRSWRILLSLFGILSTHLLRAEQPPEIVSAGSPVASSQVNPISIISDAAGNTFVTGSFSGTVTLGTNVLSSVGGFGFDDVYLVKYDPSGAVLWAKRAGGDDKEFGRALALDGQGGVYVAGTSASSQAKFGSITLFMLLKTLFLAHYDASGNCLWARRGGAWTTPTFSTVNAAMTVNALAVDSAGNPIVAGSFNGNPRFGGAAYSDSGIVVSNRNVAVPTGSEDMFLAKFSSAGAVMWATNFGSTNTEFASSIAVDSAGAIYVAGGYNTQTTLGAQTYTNAGDGILLCKLSTAGEVLWSSNLSDVTNSNPGFGWSVATDAADRINFGFEAKPATPFRFRGNSITNLTGGNFGFGLLAQFDTGGNLLWLKRTPFNGASASPGNASTLAVDASNNIYLGSSGRLLTSDGSGFLAGTLSVMKFNSAGLPVWTNSFNPSPVTFATPVVSVDAAGGSHVLAAIGGDQTYRLSIGWTNYFPFTGAGQNQLLYNLASNFVAVAPTFLFQPTNMIFQPPQGLTNSALARAWPAPKYLWYMNSKQISSATNAFLNLSPTAFSNRTTFYVVASNGFGMSTSTVVNAEVRLGFLVPPPTNINVLVGTTLAIPATAVGTSAISYQWRLNGTNLPNATAPTLTLSNLAANQSGSYTLVISNASAVLTSAPPSLVNVVLPGFVDPSITSNPVGFGATALDLLRWSDGSYYAAGGSYIYHRNPNGALDSVGPWAGTTGAGVQVLVRDSDSQFMIAGTFAGGVARMNTNGTLDATFSTGTGPANTIEGSSFNRVNSMIRLSNGQYLVAGRFNRFNGVAATNLVRLNTNGSLDATFVTHAICYSSNPVQGPGEVLRIALQADRKILVGGEFGFVDSLSVSNLVRLNPDGTLDQSFAADPQFHQPPNGRVHAILPLADGKILIGGAWQNPTNTGIARINTNGSLDLTFSGPATTAPTHAIALINNKLIIGGQNFVKRASFDGALDPTFVSASTFYWDGSQTEVMIAEPTGNVMVGGSGYGMRRLWLEPRPITIPIFSSGAGLAMVNGQFQLSACGGVDGQMIVIQASLDLINWTSISTNTVTGGCITFTDSQPSAFPNRYYRLTVP